MTANDFYIRSKSVKHKKKFCIKLKKILTAGDNIFRFREVKLNDTLKKRRRKEKRTKKVGLKNDLLLVPV